MPEFKAHNLWPIPVYESEIPVKEEWKKYIRNLNYERTWIGNSDISTDRYVLNEMPDLKLEIENNCERFVRKYLHIKSNAQFYLQNSWTNIHSPYESSQLHYHGNSLLSGVYYPILPKDSGNIQFCKSHIYNNLFHPSIRFEFDELFYVNSDSYKLELKEGTVIIFPSHLEHSVEKNWSTERRYSLAFNFYVRGKFGKEEYDLEIK